MEEGALSPPIEFVLREDRYRVLIEYVNQNQPSRRKSLLQRQLMLTTVGLIELLVMATLDLPLIGALTCIAFMCLARCLPHVLGAQHIQNKRRQGGFHRILRFQPNTKGLLMTSSMGKSLVYWETILGWSRENGHVFLTLRNDEVLYLNVENATSEVKDAFFGALHMQTQGGERPIARLGFMP